MNCLSNNNLQFLTGAAAYESGSYAVMPMCDMGEKLQLNSDIDRRVEKFRWNTPLIHFYFRTSYS